MRSSSSSTWRRYGTLVGVVLLFGLLPACGKLFSTGLEGVSPAEQERLRKITQGDLGAATTELERFYALDRAAKNALYEENVAQAEALANELAQLARKYPNDWNYGNAIQDSNQVLGRIALANGDVAEAGRRLLASADSKGSPQMNSFGPNMQLAKALLEKGETEVVIEYFNRCGTFWSMGKRDLRKWTSAVQAGKVPEFGGNLHY
jgi:multidrug efflux pump subunit AcrA (membrane-fusion protein)